jgi:hypothetical protein
MNQLVTLPAANNGKMLRHIFAALSASLISVGIARFAYTPLLPVLIEARWAVGLGRGLSVGGQPGRLSRRGAARKAPWCRLLQRRRASSYEHSCRRFAGLLRVSRR